VTLTREAQALDNVTEMIFERGTLVDIHVGKPTFQRRLRQNDLLIEGLNEDVLHLGHKKLLPKKALEDLNTLEGRARNGLASRSLTFPVSGARFVRREALSEVLASLQSIKVQWQSKVEELVQEYPALKAKQLEEFEKQAKALVKTELEKIATASEDIKAARKARYELWLEQQKTTNLNLYPAVNTLASLFPFTWRMFKVSAVGMNETNELEHQQFMAAQNQLKADLQLWVRSATAEMHRTLGEAALNAKQLLEKNGKLDPRNLRPLFNAFDTFSSVDFTGASSFHQVIEQIKNRFGARDLAGNIDYEQTSLSVASSTAAFNELLTSVANLAELEVAEKAGVATITKVGEFSRVLEL
jgi:hypothetical protein